MIDPEILTEPLRQIHPARTDPDARSGRRPLLRAPGRLTVRRTIGVLVILAMAGAIYWVVFFSGMLTPLLSYVEPAKQFIDWVSEDPVRMVTAAAAIIIPHIGLYALLFDDRLR